mmetsp:Transcript_12323/g.33101  ORF Transcript_12323/g.33101 Transcript_12323/m.33101 type:complete len:83 (+) Transcript_12323:483-731(+)
MPGPLPAVKSRSFGWFPKMICLWTGPLLADTDEHFEVSQDEAALILDEAQLTREYERLKPFCRPIEEAATEFVSSSSAHEYR